MARTKQHENNQKPFVLRDNKTKPIDSLKGVPPWSQRDAIIMSSDENRSFSSKTIAELRKSWVMPRVQSNHELVERIDQYFELVQNREVPPTIEELSLYCGYTYWTIRDWESGANKGFSDVESGLTTSNIVKRTKEFLHAYDAIMAASGKMNFLSYCFRSKNYYNMSDKQELVVVSDHGSIPLTPEEIAKNLPEPTDTVDVDTSYSVE